MQKKMGDHNVEYIFWVVINIIIFDPLDYRESGYGLMPVTFLARIGFHGFETTSKLWR